MKNSIRSLDNYCGAMRFSFLLMSLLFFSVGQAQSPVAQHGALSVSGNRVVNASGQSFSLAGNSLFWSNNGWGGEKYYNASVVSWLGSDWDTQVIRAAMGVEDAGGYLSDANGNKQKVQTIVDAAIAEGMYVIIDWHSHHAESYQSEAVSFFQEMATQYGGYDNVIYEIYNEPLQVSWDNTIRPYAQAVVNAIRAIDPDNLIVVGTPTWSQDVDVASNNPLSGNNIAYTLHFYAGTHTQSLRNKATTAMNNGIALVATEWGTVNANGDGAVAYAETDNWMNFLETHGITHCNWSINDKAEGASALNPGASATGGWSTSTLTPSGTLVRDIIKNWNGGGSTSCTRVSLPGTVQAESWCAQNGVQTEATTDAGGGENVGWIDAGDWMEYDVNVPSSGAYTVNFRVASPTGGGSFELKNGANVLTSVGVSATGGWQSWVTVSKSVTLSAGDQTLRVAATAGGFNINWLEFETEGSGGSSEIKVTARGNCGGESMELRIDNTPVQSWTLTSSMADYTFSNFSGGNIKVAFTNDADNGCDLNMLVDYITVGATVLQTENSATRTGCGDSQWLWCNGHFDFGAHTGGSSVAATGISLSPGSVTLEEGETQSLTATITPSNASNQNITWSSSNTAIASVNGNGLVSAISAGSATISATTEDGGHTDASSITVVAPSSSVLRVRARGNCGGENLALHVNGTTVANWSLTSTASNYEYSEFVGGNVEVAFTNDANNGCDLNMYVDYVMVGNTTYQTETTASRTGCGNSEWLWCNGHFSFGNLSSGARSVFGSNVLDEASKVQIYPNPLYEGDITFDFPNILPGTTVSIMDVGGRLVMNRTLAHASLKLNRADFQQGVYLLRVNTARQPRTYKFIVK